MLNINRPNQDKKQDQNLNKNLNIKKKKIVRENSDCEDSTETDHNRNLDIVKKKLTIFESTHSRVG